MMSKFTLLLVFLGVLFIQTQAQVTLHMVQTAQNTDDRLTALPDVEMSSITQQADDVYVLQVNTSEKYQEMIGFGGAFTESAAYVLSTLQPSLRQQVMDMYFGDEGNQYNLGRTHIGSCDYALEFYNYDDTVNDTSLENFSIDHDKKLLLPFILNAQEMVANASRGEKLMMIGSPWSAPGWMKNNGNMSCFPYGGSVTNFCSLNDAYRPSWALYFSKYLTSMKKEGVNFYAVTVQNEPTAGAQTYEGMHYTPQSERDFVKGFLGPQLKQDHPDIKIFIHDHNKDNVAEWANVILSDPDAAQYVDGVAFHWYTGDYFENVQAIHDQFPTTALLASEETEGEENRNGYKNPTWHKGEHYAHDMIGDFNAWTQGYIDWNLILDTKGGPDHGGPDDCEGLIRCGSDSMIIADASTQTIYPQVFYWYVGHFSRYVRRQSHRVELQVTQPTTSPKETKDDPPAYPELEYVAFQNPDESVVVVVMNGDDVSKKVSISDIGMSVGTSEPLVMPPHSIRTFTYQGK